MSMPEPVPHNEIQEELEKIERKRKLHALLFAIGFGLIVLIVLLLLFRDQIFGPGPGELVVDDTDVVTIEDQDEGDDTDKGNLIDQLYNTILGTPAYQSIYGAVNPSELTLDDLRNQIQFCDDQITELVNQINGGQVQVNTMVDQIADAEDQIDDYEQQIEDLEELLAGGAQIGDLDEQINYLQQQIDMLRTQIRGWLQQVAEYQASISGWQNQVVDLSAQISDISGQITGLDPQLEPGDPQFITVAAQLDGLWLQIQTAQQQIVAWLPQVQYYLGQVVIYFQQFTQVFQQFIASDEQLSMALDIRNVVIEVSLTRSTYNPDAGTARIVGSADVTQLVDAVTLRVRYVLPGGERMLASGPGSVFQLGVGGAGPGLDDPTESYVYEFEFELTDVPPNAEFEIISATGNLDDFTSVGSDQDRYIWDLRPNETGFQQGGFGQYFLATDTTTASVAYDACLVEAQGYYNTVFGAGVYTVDTSTCVRESTLQGATGAPVPDPVTNFYVYDNQPDVAGLQQSEVYPVEADCMQAAANFYDVAYGTDHPYAAVCFVAEFDDTYYGQEDPAVIAQATAADAVATALAAPALFGPTPFALLPGIAYRWFFYESFSPLTRFTADLNLDGTEEEVYFETQTECQRVGQEFLAAEDPDFAANPRQITCYREEVAPPAAQWFFYEVLNNPNTVANAGRFTDRANCEAAATAFHAGAAVSNALLQCYADSTLSQGQLQVGSVQVLSGERVRFAGSFGIGTSSRDRGIRVQWGEGPTEVVEGDEQALLAGSLGISLTELLREVTPTVARVFPGEEDVQWEYELTQLTPDRTYYFRIIDADTGYPLTGIRTFKTVSTLGAAPDGNFTVDLGELTQVTLGDGTVVTVVSAGNGLVPCGHDGDNAAGVRNGRLDDYEVCAFEHFVLSADRLIKWLFRFGVAPIAALALTYAGVSLFFAKGNPERLKFAKGFLWRVVIGIVIALSAWVIVSSILAFMGVQRQVWYYDVDPSTEMREYGPAFVKEVDCIAAVTAFYASQGFSSANPACFSVPTSYVLLGE